MAIAYKSAGAGFATASNGADLLPLCPAVVDANDILIAHVCTRDTTSSRTIPSGWALLAGPQVLTAVGRHWIFGKIADGTEDATAISFGTAGGTVVRSARIYSFSGYTGGAITDVVVGIGHAIGTATTVSDTAVTTVGTASLAVQLAYVSDDNGLVDGTVVHMTGETGGDWTDPVGQYVYTTGLDGLQFIQVAAMASPGTIDGGSRSITTSVIWGCYGFEIRPFASRQISVRALRQAVGRSVTW